MTKIIIHTTPEDLSKMRFTYSPLLEMSLSVQVLRDPALQGGHHRWVEESKRALYDVELPYLEALVSSECGYIPDFITPTPMQYQTCIEDDFEKLLSTPEQLIRENIQKLIQRDGDSDIRRSFLTHPREAIWCLVEELRLYWQRTFARSWSQMISVIEGDLLYRGKLLALDGPSKLLPDLHHSISFQNNQIQVGSIQGETAAAVTARHEGNGFQLVPTIFADWVWAQLAPQLNPMIVYRARGTGGIYNGDTGASKPLELAMGAGRAKVLQSLRTPASTGELAQRLGVSSGAVSQLLNRLTKAGLVEPHRIGKRVYYRLTRRGEELIALFERIP